MPPFRERGQQLHHLPLLIRAPPRSPVVLVPAGGAGARRGTGRGGTLALPFSLVRVFFVDFRHCQRAQPPVGLPFLV